VPNVLFTMSNTKLADPGGVGLRPFACWNCRFEPRQVHGCRLVVIDVCVENGGLCDGLITRPEESYRVWSV
jgi:hypothetical protein